LEGLKGAVTIESFKEPSQRENSKKTIKKLFEDRYTSGKNKWFFEPLRVSSRPFFLRFSLNMACCRSSDPCAQNTLYALMTMLAYCILSTLTSLPFLISYNVNLSSLLAFSRWTSKFEELKDNLPNALISVDELRELLAGVWWLLDLLSTKPFNFLGCYNSPQASPYFFFNTLRSGLLQKFRYMIDCLHL
jgi:hypothetical protein